MNDEQNVIVERGSFKLEAEGEWLRLYVKEPKFGWVQKIGMDGNGAKNFFDTVSLFLSTIQDIVKKSTEEEKKKAKKAGGIA